MSASCCQAIEVLTTSSCSKHVGCARSDVPGDQDIKRGMGKTIGDSSSPKRRDEPTGDELLRDRGKVTLAACYLAEELAVGPQSRFSTLIVCSLEDFWKCRQFCLRITVVG